MLSLTILTMAVAVTSALPRGELGMEEGNLYPGLYRDQTMDEKEGRNLDSIDSLQNKNQNTARMKRNLSEMQKSQWSKRDGVSIQRPIYNHRHDKKEGGTLDSLGGGHLIRNLHGNGDNYEHEIKKEALNTDYHLDTRGGGNLLRDLEAVLRTHPNLFYGRSARNHDALDSLSGITFGSQKRYDSLSPAYAADKRNFDEIDRTGFNSFIKKKKNFDEIDRTGFDGFVKRNFDEIDRVGFGSFIKKSGDPRH